MTCGKRLNGKKTHRTTEGPVSISRLKKKRGGERKAEGFAYVTKKNLLDPHIRLRSILMITPN